MRRRVTLFFAALLTATLLGCAKSDAPESEVNKAVPEPSGKPPPAMPGGMGKDGRPVGPAPEDSAKAGG